MTRRSRVPVSARRGRGGAHGAAALLTITAGLVACADEPGLPPAAPSNPVAGSEVIAGVEFDWSTHRREAPGSDNWPMTWAGDGHQYTSWGDGRGFGSDSGNTSLGFSRIVGDADSYEGEDLFYGAPRVSGLEFDAKTYGLIALDGALYAWLSPGSDRRAWEGSRLYRSDDSGGSWTFTGVEIPGETGLALPWFLQAGRGYEQRPDDYVYVYFLEVQDSTVWEVQVPGRIALARIPLGALEDRSAYQFFGGPDDDGNPRWVSDIEDREAIIDDPNGLMRASTIYVPELGRFILIANHTAKNSGNMAWFDSPTPWGPWTAVLYEQGWGRGEIPTNTFYWSLAPKWMDEDGRRFVLVFTGKEENDSWNSVEGRFELREGSRSVDASPGR